MFLPKFQIPNSKFQKVLFVIILTFVIYNLFGNCPAAAGSRLGGEILEIGNLMPQPANAAGQKSAQTIEIYPAVFNFKYLPGTGSIKILNIKNQSENPVVFRLFLSPISASKENNFSYFLRLFSFLANDQTIMLPPFSQKEIRFSVNIPKNAPLGGYYGQIMMEPLINNANGKFLQIVPIFAVPVLIDVVTLEKADLLNPPLSLENIKLNEQFKSRVLRFVFNKIFRVPAAHAEGPVALTEKSPFHFFITLKNNGKFIERPEGKISVYNLKGEKLSSADFTETSLLPNENKTIEIKTDLKTDKLLSFIFPQRLRAEIETKNSKNEFIFWVFSWKKSLATLATIISLMFLMLLRRRIYCALKVLMVTK